METTYIPEVLNEAGVSVGVSEEVLGNESKNLLLSLMKQVRPGMDLSRIPLPTFILEPRSLLAKLGY